MADYDLAIIGGGLNGVSIARDAAGRGLRVILLEQGDLGAGASQASPRLIHGDLAGLERRAFFRVRAALGERDIWLRIAPHLVRPMRFVDPRPFRRAPALAAARRGCCCMTGWPRAPACRRRRPIDVTHHPVGNALKRPFGTRLRIFRLRGRRFPAGGAQRRRCRGARRRRSAPARAASAPTGSTSGGWRRSIAAIARWSRRARWSTPPGAWTASVAETVLRVPPPDVGCGPDQPDRGPPPVRHRQRLCVPEQRPAADFRQPL